MYCFELKFASYCRALSLRFRYNLLKFTPRSSFLLYLQLVPKEPPTGMVQDKHNVEAPAILSEMHCSTLCPTLTARYALKTLPMPQ